MVESKNEVGRLGQSLVVVALQDVGAAGSVRLGTSRTNQAPLGISSALLGCLAVPRGLSRKKTCKYSSQLTWMIVENDTEESKIHSAALTQSPTLIVLHATDSDTAIGAANHPWHALRKPKTSTFHATISRYNDEAWWLD